VTNLDLLAAQPQLLTTLEKQRRFVLQQAAREVPCPNCNTPLDKFRAMGVTINQYDTDGLDGDRQYRCPNCKRELKFHLPLTGSWFWRLVPQ